MRAHMRPQLQRSLTLTVLVVVGWFGVAVLVLGLLEKKTNPIGWNLQTQIAIQKIIDNAPPAPK